MRNFGERQHGPGARDEARANRAGRGRGFQGYDSEYERLGGDYEDLPRHAATDAQPEHGFGWPRRRMVVQRDWREWGDYRAGAPRGREEAGPDGYGDDIMRGYDRGAAGARSWWIRPETVEGGHAGGVPGRRVASGGRRGRRDVPPDYRRYLSRDEYGLPPELERDAAPPRYDRDFREREERSGRMRTGGRNALFGGVGFRRYERDYDDYAW